MSFCLVTDVVLVVSLFTSQIFGHILFYAPFDLKAVKTMKIGSLISIFVEHLPQLIVQCFVLWFSKSESQWSTISITSLCVSLIDTFTSGVKIIMWLVVMKEMKIGMGY